MKTKNKLNKKKKRPVAITLVIVWMFYMVLRGIFKAFNFERLELNKQIFGTLFALVNYWIDIAILILFVVFIILFIKKIPKTWKYFIYLISFLILGVIISIVYNILYFDKMASIILPNGFTPTLLVVTSVVTYILLLVFYLIIIYFVYKNRGYFEK